MSQPHGVRATETSGGTRAINTVSTSVIGFVATADDADAQAYPLNTPVLLTGINADALAAAGTGGTLLKTLSAIRSQTSTTTVVVRVAEDDAAQDDEVIAGVDQLLVAQSLLGVKPKILGAPGLDTQQVTAALVSAAKKLKAFVYAKAHGTDKTDRVDYRANFGDRELMLITPSFKGYDPAAEAAGEIEATACAVGLRAYIDQTVGWHKSLSNVTVQGVTGLTEGVSFDLLSSDNDAGYYNNNDITTLIRQDGFRFWGNRTTSSDPLFAFECYVRTAQTLLESIATAHLWAIDKPLTAGLASDIIEGINAKLREMISLGQLIGGEAYLTDTNTASTLKAGQLYVGYKYTPVPPLECLHLAQEITDEYLIDFAAQVAA